MSVTFFIEGGPTRQVQEIDWEGELAFDAEGKPVMYNEDVHAINVANPTAQSMLNAIGFNIGEDWYGKFEVKDLPDLRQRLLSAINRDVIEFTRPGGEIGNPGGCRIIDCGLTDDVLLHRLQVFLDIVATAHELNLPVVYA